MVRYLQFILLTVIIFWFATPVQARGGILGQQAPELGLTHWIDGEGKPTKPIQLSDYQGKVVYLFFFQDWCPGCQKYGFPTLKQVSDKFTSNDNVQFFAVQTVFEGSALNTKDKLSTNQKRHNIQIPMAHDGGTDLTDNRSIVMGKYQSGGTPWTIIIDKTGRVVYNQFHIKPNVAIGMIQKLLKM